MRHHNDIFLVGAGSHQAASATLATHAIDPEESVWSLDEDLDSKGEAIKVLMINIMRPPLTESERVYKGAHRYQDLLSSKGTVLTTCAPPQLLRRVAANFCMEHVTVADLSNIACSCLFGLL